MTWLTVEKAAKLLGITERGVRKAATEGRYVFNYKYGVGAGGKVIEIQLESLSAAAQERYKAEAAPQFEPTMDCQGPSKNEQKGALNIVQFGLRKTPCQTRRLQPEPFAS